MKEVNKVEDLTAASGNGHTSKGDGISELKILMLGMLRRLDRIEDDLSAVKMAIVPAAVNDPGFDG